MSRTYHLHKWSVSMGSNDPYLPPEASSVRLHGYRDNEERAVITSPIVKVDGRTITTYSGSTYILEDISPEYVEWMKENNISYDPENPIRVKTYKSLTDMMEPGKKEPTRCSSLDHPNIAPSWGCCVCSVLNGDQRKQCKHCGHSRCDLNPKNKVS